MPDIKILSNYIFNNCKGFSSSTTLTIPEKVETIGNYAFANWENIGKLEIGSNVKEIGSYAFYECSSIDSSGNNYIIFPESLGKIGDYAFYDCSKLKYIDFGENLVSIGKYALQTVLLYMVELWTTL